jgi:hypothetical protein
VFGGFDFEVLTIVGHQAAGRWEQV